MNIYRNAWEHLRDTIGTKTSWGRNELATAMAEALEYAVQVEEEGEELARKALARSHDARRGE